MKNWKKSKDIRKSELKMALIWNDGKFQKPISKHDTETLSDVYYFHLNLLLLSGIGKYYCNMKVKPSEREIKNVCLTNPQAWVCGLTFCCMPNALSPIFVFLGCQ